ncbi:glycosyltransferase family 4 protein [candidate division KSB1 bacterium]|nr:glycosyltransferase family 4 protein [candidate division KSB1 bacterium]
MAKSMVRQGHRVRLVTLSTSSGKHAAHDLNLQINELPVINKFPFVSITFHIQVMAYALYWVLAGKQDAVITHPITAIFLVPAILISKLLRRKTRFILDIRTLPVRSKGFSGKFKKLLHRISLLIGKYVYDGITVITPALRDFVRDEFKLTNKKIGIWMSGVDTSLFNPANYADVNKEGNNKPFRVMYHGAIADNRGIKETVEAMEIINTLLPEVQLFILGRGNAVASIKKVIKESNIRNVIVHDPVDHEEIPKFIAEADVGIIPLPNIWCWRVSSPLKLFEYLSMAKPVIVSKIEAHTHVLSNNTSCFFLDSTGSEDIARLIFQVYEKRDQLTRLGRQGREFILNNFTWDHQAKLLINYITNIS